MSLAKSRSLSETLQNPQIHDHLCSIHETEEGQARVGAQFIAIGLDRGEKTVYAGSQRARQAIDAALRHLGVDVDGRIRKGDLALVAIEDSYLAGGTFDPERAMGFFAEAAKTAAQGGYTALRGVAEMGWAMTDIESQEKLIAYESMLCRLFSQNQVIGLCQYDAGSAPKAVLRDVLCTHPKVVYENLVCPNPYYTPANEFFCDHSGAAAMEVRRILDQLVARERVDEELRHACEIALQNSRMKSEVTAIARHELRTPLAAIIGLSEVLSQTLTEAEQVSDARDIHESANRLLVMIDNLLQIAEINTGKSQVENREFQLFEMLEGLFRTFRARAEEKGLQFEVSLSDQLPARTQGDPVLIQRVLLNLMDNAIKFTQSGKVLVTVTPQFSGKPGIRFEVKDTGKGISEADRYKLFRSYTQADSLLSRRFEGAGLGLSICKGLVEQMNGQIGFESRENEGSTFWFVVPTAGQ